MTWYKIHTPEPLKKVIVSNQFGEDVLEVTDAAYLVNPALKWGMPGEPLPDGLSHFKCYFANGRPVDMPVQLETQFGHETVHVLHPEIFCNPAEKIDENGVRYPIVNEVDHLVCYRIEPIMPLGLTVEVIDQFTGDMPFPLHVEENVWLCVPSEKTGVVQVQSSTWGEVKAIYR
jgi:hypothetical protein